MKKRVGVRNDVICCESRHVKKIFNLIRRFTVSSNNVNHQICRIKYSTKSNQIKVIKSKFGKYNLENDAIHDAHKIICHRNLKKIRRYWGLLVIFALEVFQLKIVKLRRFFMAISPSLYIFFFDSLQIIDYFILTMNELLLLFENIKIDTHAFLRPIIRV